MLATMIAVVAPSMQQVFAQPMPENAGFEEIGVRFQTAFAHATSALISAWIGVIMAFFTRAAKDEPVFALTQKDGE
jgi:hypothetical protein